MFPYYWDADFFPLRNLNLQPRPYMETFSKNKEPFKRNTPLVTVIAKMNNTKVLLSSMVFYFQKLLRISCEIISNLPKNVNNRICKSGAKPNRVVCSRQSTRSPLKNLISKNNVHFSLHFHFIIFIQGKYTSHADVDLQTALLPKKSYKITVKIKTI